MTTPSTLIDPHAKTEASDAAASSELDAELRALVGRVLGHFRVDAPIGQGGMGAVFRAFDTSLHRPVALKVLLGASESARTRFIREARAQASLRHPNVVPIHYVGESDGIAFLVMDLVEGESLADRLHREGAIAPERALDIVDAIAAALESATEAGLVHRDVKPSNILIDRRGHVQLADFGLAKGALDVDAAPAPAPLRTGEITPSAAITHAGAIVGTPAYLAPEQGTPGARVDHRADVYALGVTLYEMLTGTRPFAGDTPTALLRQHQSGDAIAPRALAPNLRPALEAVVQRMLQKRPEDRFPTWPEVRAALASAREVEAVTAPFFPRLVAFAIDLGVIGFVAATVAVLTRVATLGWVVAALAMALLERAWSTPGKRLMRLRTVDRWDERPGLGASFGRWALKLWGPLLAAIVGDVFATRAHRFGQGIEGVVVIGWLLGFAIVLQQKRLALHDRATRTRVVYAVKEGETTRARGAPVTR